MKSKILLCAALLTNCATNTHHLGTTTSLHYDIKPMSSSTDRHSFDLTHGTVHYTAPDGSIQKSTRAHMARVAPWDAQEIFGKITVDIANELAGTWYIYR